MRKHAIFELCVGLSAEMLESGTTVLRIRYHNNV